jgi:hypothetical protein
MAAYSRDQIVAFENAHSLRLPERLASFLCGHGPGRYGDIEIHQPDQIRDVYTDFFDDPGELFTKWLPFGCNHQTQELWILDISGPSPRFARIWHETVPDDWADEDWRGFAGCADGELDSIGL